MLVEFAIDTFTRVPPNTHPEWLHVVVTLDTESLAVRRHIYPLVTSRRSEVGGRYLAAHHLPLAAVRRDPEPVHQQQSSSTSAPRVEPAALSDTDYVSIHSPETPEPQPEPDSASTGTSSSFSCFRRLQH